MNHEEKKEFSKPKNNKSIFRHWFIRETAVFGGMILESMKFIIASVLVFGAIYGLINGPAVWDNVKWWWYVNYVDDHSGKWWGAGFPEVGANVEPNNTLFIPKIGVEAPIQFAATKVPADINNLLQEGVVHYPDTANPGEKGNIFITGHSSYYWWSKGKYNTVFSILDKLVIGDIIYVNYDHKRYTYKVFDEKVVAATDLSVLEQGKDSIISLMTCTPVGTNYKRLIVKAIQTDPDPTKNKERVIKS